MAYYSLNDEERLVEEPSDRANGCEDEPTEHPKCGNARRLLLFAKDGKIVDDVVVDPDRAVDSGADEHAAAGPPMKVVKLLVAVTGTEQERQDRVLRSEEKDYGELCKREEP